MKSSEYFNSNAYSRNKSIIQIVLILIIVSTGSCTGPVYQEGMARDESFLEEPLTPPAQDPQTTNLWKVSDTVKLFHFEEGNGEDVLVVHGGPGIPPSHPYPGLTKLAKKYRFHYYHQRGCGKSTRPVNRLDGNFYNNMMTMEKRVGLSAQLADMERIRQILGKDQLIILGHSYGGFFAAMYAAEFPEHVKKLILVVPAGVLKMPPEDGGLYEQVRNSIRDEDVRKKYDEYIKRYFDFGSLFENDEKALQSLNNEFIPYYEMAARASGMNTGENVYPEDVGGFIQQANFFSLGKKSDFTGYLKKVKASALIISSGRDLSSGSGVEAYKAIPRSTNKFMIDSGHFPFYDDPDRFAELVDRYLINDL